MFLYSDSMVTDAFSMANEAHAGQRRKYTGEPFIAHPVRVAIKVMSVCNDPTVIAAALLHDVVEDTDVTIDRVMHEFGAGVARLVAAVTNVVENDGSVPRRVKFATNLKHLAAAPSDAQTIKFADMLDNVPSIVLHDSKFASVYIPEKIMVLGILKEGDPTLRAELEGYLARLVMEL